MLGRALALYNRHFGAILLTAAVALVPANLLMAGAVTLGVAGIGVGGADGARSHMQQVQEKQQDLPLKSLAPDERDARVRQLGREAVEGKAAFDADKLRLIAALAYAVFVIVAILLAGLALAHAALVPLVLELESGARAGPAHAWAVVASRFRSLAWTGILGVFLVALGSVFCLIPGVVLMIGFSFAIPVTLLEGISGRAALERSWALMKGRWLPVTGMFALLVIFTALASGVAMAAPVGPWRIVISSAVRVVSYPLPLAGLILLYPRTH